MDHELTLIEFDVDGLESEFEIIYQPVPFSLNEVKDDWHFKFRTKIQENPSVFRSFSVRDGFVFRSAGIINNRQFFCTFDPVQ